LVEYLYGLDHMLVPWTQSRIEGMVFDKDAKAIGAARGNAIVACVVFDEFTLTSCQIAIASDSGKRWLTREYVVRTFTYPFLQCDLQRIGCLVSINNKPSIRLIRGMGFKQEGVIRKAGIHGEDMIAFGMLREECRFLPRENKLKKDIVTFSK